jgi:transcription elongation factor Elf1
MTDKGRTQTVYPTDYRCPLCGAQLISNGRDVWCERAAYPLPACVYGLEYTVRACKTCGGPAHEGECDGK